MSNDNRVDNEAPKYIPDSDNTNKYYKIYLQSLWSSFWYGYNLGTHITGAHHPKRTVTVNDIVNSIFKGQMNFPKTKAEIVKYIEDHKDDDPAVTPEVLDVIRNIQDKDSSNEGELSLELNQ